MPDRCPTCNSPDPHRHPAVQFEGEVELCIDAFHLRETPQNRPDYIRAVQAKRAAKDEVLTYAPLGDTASLVIANMAQPSLMPSYHFQHDPSLTGPTAQVSLYTPDSTNAPNEYKPNPVLTPAEISLRDAIEEEFADDVIPNGFGPRDLQDLRDRVEQIIYNHRYFKSEQDRG